MNHEPSSITLSDEERRLLGLWAADCAERVLPLFEAQARELAAVDDPSVEGDSKG